MPDCPHCQHALPSDPASGLPPARCPHCGAASGDPRPGGPSLASFLRPGAPGATQAAPAARYNPILIDPAAASPGPQAQPKTANGACVPQTTSTLEPNRSQAPALPPPGDAAAPARTDGTHVLHDAGASSAATVPGQAAHAAADARAAASTEADLDPYAEDRTPSFIGVVPRPQARRVPGWQWAVLALLVAALGVQMLVADRARLAQDARWRPLLERTCAVLRCSLPAWHQPQAYTMLAREVHPLPGAAGVLQVHATFRNDARWPQQWPAIAVSLSDADGRTLGGRVLLPKDYLEPDLRQTTLAPGQSAQMTVQVREPPGGAVAFAFDFR